MKTFQNINTNVYEYINVKNFQTPVIYGAIKHLCVDELQRNFNVTIKIGINLWGTRGEVIIVYFNCLFKNLCRKCFLDCNV